MGCCQVWNVHKHTYVASLASQLYRVPQDLPGRYRAVESYGMADDNTTRNGNTRMTNNPAPLPRPRLTAGTGLLVVALYAVGSIAVGLILAIFFGGPQSSQNQRLIDGVIGRGMITNIVVMAGILWASLWLFRDSRTAIFFEGKPFTLSKVYYLYPLAWIVVSLLALTQVPWNAYTIGDVLLVVLASLVIGINEELVTRGILLTGLRNSGMREWLAWIGTLIVFSLLHLVNLLGGGSPVVLIIVLTGGTILYVARRVFGTILVPILMHALYDTAFLLLTGPYLVTQDLPDRVLDIQLGSFLVLLLVSVLFLIFGRALFRDGPNALPTVPADAS